MEDPQLLIAAKEKLFANVQSLTEEVTDLQCKLIRAESERTSSAELYAREREDHSKELDELRNSLHDAEQRLAELRQELAEHNRSNIMQRSEHEKEVAQLKNSIETLQKHTDMLTAEIEQSRIEMRGANDIVNNVKVQLSKQESIMQRREAELEAQLKEKDELLKSKSQITEATSIDMSTTNFDQSSSIFHPLQSHRQSKISDEVQSLRKQLMERQLEIDQHKQRYADLLKQTQGNPLQQDSERTRLSLANQNRIQELETKINEQLSTICSQTDQLNMYKKRVKDLDQHNSMLVAQFATDFMSAHFDEDVMHEDVEGGRRYENVQQIIQDNIQLQIDLDEAKLGTDRSMMPAPTETATTKLMHTMDELERCRIERDEAQAAQKQLQQRCDFYKNKYDQFTLGVDDGVELPLVSPASPSDDAKQQLRSKMDYEVELHKQRCELDIAKDRIESMKEKYEQKENEYEQLLAQKNEHITELTSSKDALELQAVAQSDLVDSMNKRLEELSKDNQKLDGQKHAAAADTKVLSARFDDLNVRYKEIAAENHNFKKLRGTFEAERDADRHELAQLRNRINMLQDNESVSLTVTSALDEFRAAYTKIDSAQFAEIKERLQATLKQNETLAGHVQAITVQQMVAMDGIKTTLTECQLQRDRYAKRTETLEHELNALQLEHAEVKEKYEVLNKQMTEIDASDVSLESCRKQIQQLRNRITYLERTLTATVAGNERWKAQLEVSEQQCRMFKQLAADMENSLREKDQQAQLEREQLERRIAENDQALREARTTVDELRAELTTRGTADAERIVEQERARDEWRERIATLDSEKEALHARLELVEQELRTQQTRADEAEATIRQKSAEAEQTQTEYKTANEKLEECNREVEELRTERELLSTRLESVDRLQEELKKTHDVEINTLRAQIDVLEKTALAAQEADLTIKKTIGDLCDQVAADADSLPLQLPQSNSMNNEDASRVKQLVELYRRERNEASLRRRSEVAELQRAASARVAAASTTPHDAVAVAVAEASSRESVFMGTITRLKSQLENKDADIAQLSKQSKETEVVRAELDAEQRKVEQLREMARRFRDQHKVAQSWVTTTQKIVQLCQRCSRLAPPLPDARASAAPGGAATAAATNAAATAGQPSTAAASTAAAATGDDAAAAAGAPVARRPAAAAQAQKRRAIQVPESSNDGDDTTQPPPAKQQPPQQQQQPPPPSSS